MPLDLNVRPVLDEKYVIPKTIEFIKAKAAVKKPFFVYVSYSEVHPPVIANPAFAGKSAQRGGFYSDVIGEMDHRVGQILDAIKEARVDDNTIVILSSDNAAGRIVSSGGGGSNGPWHGDFFTPPFEGSYRTLGMVRWPGHVPAGLVTQKMLAPEDWLPTLAAIVGASALVPKDRPIDGVDASAFMLGKRDTTGRTLSCSSARRRADVGQVEDLQGDLSLLRRPGQAHRQAAVSDGVRPEQRPPRRLEPRRHKGNVSVTSAAVMVVHSFQARM
jgi:arylsulfatase